MLTEKSITQQLRFHKLPFPEDLVEEGVHDGTGGNHCFVPEKWASSHHPQKGGSSCLLTRGRRRDEWGTRARRWSHLGRRISFQLRFSTQDLIQKIHSECCVDGWGIQPCLCLQGREEAGRVEMMDQSTRPILKALLYLCNGMSSILHVGHEPWPQLLPSPGASWDPSRHACLPPSHPPFSPCI